MKVTLQIELPNELLGAITVSHLDKINRHARKKQGIYYTPSYIVTFILENTLSQNLKQKWKKLEQLFNEEKYEELVKFFKENSKINIIDPACGSGIFLIKAKDFFNNYHDKIQSKFHTLEKKGEHSADIKSTFENVQSLSKFDEQTVLEQIYGCDLDSVALKNTIKNLQLESSKSDEKILFNENIVLGDFLISGLEEYDDVSIFHSEIENIKELRRSIKESPLDGSKRKLHTREKKLKKQLSLKVNKTLERYFPTELNRIIPFNSEIEFPEVMSKGGFDIIIGNPPYFTIEGRRSNERTIYYSYLKESEKWKRFFRSNSDIYYYFIIQSLKSHSLKGFLLKKSALSPLSMLQIRGLSN